MKTCINCLQSKNLSEYYKHPKTKDGYITKCKKCVLEYKKLSLSPEKQRIIYARDPNKRLQIIYHCIKSRCNDIKNSSYRWYGGRGILCLRKSSKEFIEDMKESYIIHYINHREGNRNTQIDRIDNNGNYCKENCTWVTASEQHKSVNIHGCKGVYYDKAKKKWGAYMQYNGKVVLHKKYENLEKAIDARKNMEKVLLDNKNDICPKK